MGRWRVIALQSEPAPDSPQAQFLAPGTQYLWQEHYGIGRYEDAKKDQWKWETTCQQRPEQATPQRFERSWLRVYVDKIYPSRFRVWIIVDPALSTNRKADRTSIMALAGLRQSRLALVDWALDRFRPDQRTLAIIKMANKWDADAILYEEIGLLSDTFYLDRDAEAFGLNCPVIAVGRGGSRHNMSKDTRIAGLLPDFIEGRIVLPGKMMEIGQYRGLPGWEYLDKVKEDFAPLPYFMYRQVDGKVVDLMSHFIESEYMPWAGPKSLEHDEGLDTLSRIHDPEFAMTYASDDTPDSEVEEIDDGLRRDSGEGQFERTVSSNAGWFSKY